VNLRLSAGTLAALTLAGCASFGKPGADELARLPVVRFGDTAPPASPSSCTIRPVPPCRWKRASTAACSTAKPAAPSPCAPVRTSHLQAVGQPGRQELEARP
jgi:hypothetical protein